MEKLIKCTTKNMTVLEDAILFVKGSGDKEKVLASIRFCDIKSIYLRTAASLSAGYITFFTGDGVGEAVQVVFDATTNQYSAAFVTTMNPSVIEFVQSLQNRFPNIKVAEYPQKRPKPAYASPMQEQHSKPVMQVTTEPRLLNPQYAGGSTPPPLSKKQQLKERIKEAEESGVACCPKCGCTSLSANKKGFGIGKAVVGAAMTGGIGLVAGNLGAKKVRITCLKCGHQWMAGK